MIFWILLSWCKLITEMTFSLKILTSSWVVKSDFPLSRSMQVEIKSNLQDLMILAGTA